MKAYMNNDWFHEYFINELKAIGNHSKCADGKSAYDYAVESGYTGTETEFAEKMAEEQLTGTTNDLTPTQVYEAVSSGIPVKVQYTDPTFGISSFTAFNVSESMNVIASNAIVNYKNMYLLAVLYGIKSDNRWSYEITTLAEHEDIPSALPNPNALTFTGAVTGSYDGSAPLSVEIPTGAMIVEITDNGGALSADKTFTEIRDAILSGTTVLASRDGTVLSLITLAVDFMWFGVTRCTNDEEGAFAGTEGIEITENGDVNDISAGILGAQEPLIGSIDDIKPSQVYAAVQAGRPVILSSGLFVYTAFSVSPLIVLSSVIFNNEIHCLSSDSDTDTWIEDVIEIPTKIPTALPNPNALTFTGAVTGSYDGSKPLSVKIPSAVTDAHINSLIDTKLGVIENGSY